MRFHNAGHRLCASTTAGIMTSLQRHVPMSWELPVCFKLLVYGWDIRGKHKDTQLVKAFTSQGVVSLPPVTIRFCCLTGLGVFAALAGSVGGDVRPAGATVRAVPPGPVDRRVDEDPLAGRRLAHAEPVEAEVGQPDGEPH